MSSAMRRHALASSILARSLWIAEEDQDRVADELVEGAAVIERDLRHLGESIR